MNGLKGTEITGQDIIIGGKDLSSFIHAYIKGYRFLHKNESPRKVVVPKILFVDKVLVEYEVQNIVKKEGKDAKTK